MKKIFVVHIETENWQAWSQDLSLIYNWTCSNLKEGLSANEYTHFFKSPKLLQILCLAWISDLFKWIWWMMFTSFLLIYLTSSRLVAQKAVTRDSVILVFSNFLHFTGSLSSVFYICGQSSSPSFFWSSTPAYPIWSPFYCYFWDIIRVTSYCMSKPSESSLLYLGHDISLTCFLIQLASKFCKSFLSICCGILRAPGNLSVLSTFWSI